jgi:hypothetical protein
LLNTHSKDQKNSHDGAKQPEKHKFPNKAKPHNETEYPHLKEHSQKKKQIFNLKKKKNSQSINGSNQVSVKLGRNFLYKLF